MERQIHSLVTTAFTHYQITASTVYNDPDGAVNESCRPLARDQEGASWSLHLHATTNPYVFLFVDLTGEKPFIYILCIEKNIDYRKEGKLS